MCFPLLGFVELGLSATSGWRANVDFSEA
jgi:hypothetical protein